jgi:hypothetical protein
MLQAPDVEPEPYGPGEESHEEQKNKRRGPVFNALVEELFYRLAEFEFQPDTQLAFNGARCRKPEPFIFLIVRAGTFVRAALRILAQ